MNRAPFVLCLAAALTSCGGDNGGTTCDDDPTAPGCPTGSIRVTTSTDGPTEFDLDPDGYEVSVDGGSQRAIGVNETLTLSGVPLGNRRVELSGNLQTCQVAGDNPRDAAVLSETRTATVEFQVNCAAITSHLEVQTATSGDTLDPDGYTVVVDSESSQVSLDGTVMFFGLEPDIAHSVELDDVAANCSVANSAQRSVNIVVGDTGRVMFDVSCAPALFDRIAYTGWSTDNWDVYTVETSVSTPTNLTSDPANDAQAAWSRDGTSIAFVSTRTGDWEIYTMAYDGSNLQNRTNYDTADDGFPAWSPDGTKIAFVSDRDGDSDIFVMNADGTNALPLTGDSANDSFPAWSPDGSRVAFSRESGLWVVNADGSGLRQLSGGSTDIYPTFSPDPASDQIVFASRRDGDWDIYLMDATGVYNLTSSTSNDTDPEWSPDGSLIAFTSDRDGDFEIYLMTLEGTIVGQLTGNSSSDIEPTWSPMR